MAESVHPRHDRAAASALLLLAVLAAGCGAGAAEPALGSAGSAARAKKPPPSPSTTPPPSTGGAIAWQVQLAGPTCGVRPALGPDGTVYAVDVSQNLHAVSPAGTLLWTVAGAGGKGLAVGADGTIYAGSEDAIQAFAPDGTRRWTFVMSPRALILLGLAIGPDGNLYGVATEGLGVFSLTPQGSLRWTSPEPYDRPNVSYGELVFGASAASALSPAGAQRWQATATDWISGPVADPTNTLVVFAGNDPATYGGVLDAFSTGGARLWRLAFPAIGGFGQSVDGRVRFTPDGARAYVVTAVQTGSWATSHAYLTAIAAR